MSRPPHPPAPPLPHNFLTPPESPRPRRNLEEPLVQLLQNLTLQELRRPRRRYPVPPRRRFARSTRREIDGILHLKGHKIVENGLAFSSL
ncbi:Phosphatidylinositol 4-Phosphate 3-Kinase C2 Domain-Containing Subunit Gamma [Manis pentadactyla]|nr:Phosphatidylinositol 4-Phosphate 3-Kinase C2 Domain-Containing Subunit Gamma [Manis pentadactyla]